MHKLITVLKSRSLANDLRDLLTQALLEAYSEGHCDGQNAAEEDDPSEYPRDIDIAWAQSQTLRQVLNGLK
jgi:hypothetical protein